MRSDRVTSSLFHARTLDYFFLSTGTNYTFDLRLTMTRPTTYVYISSYVRITSSRRVRGSGDYPSKLSNEHVPVYSTSPPISECVARTPAAHLFGEGQATLDKALTDCVPVYATMTAGLNEISSGAPRVFRGRLILSTVGSDWLFPWQFFVIQLITSGSR